MSHNACLNFETPFRAGSQPVLQSSVCAPFALAEPLQVAAPAGRPRAGDLVVAEVVSPGAAPIERVDGEMIPLEAGLRIGGVLGCRRALRGYSGRVPTHLEEGQPLALLNLGGIIGEALDWPSDLGPPATLQLVGCVCGPDGPLNLAGLQTAPHPAVAATWPPIPLVAVAGTGMDTGKTAVAAAIVQGLSRAGMRTAAAKVSGAACLRDLLALERAGARAVSSFLSAGLESTVGVTDLAAVARRLVCDVARSDPEIVLLEIGDGLLGDYGVSSLFEDASFKAACTALVLCAPDPVAAWGGEQWLESRGFRVDLVSGPVTDTAAGTAIVARSVAPAANARLCPESVAARVLQTLEAKRC